jgi:hypothetical protein
LNLGCSNNEAPTQYLESLNSEFGGHWLLIDPQENCFSLEVRNSPRIRASKDSLDLFAIIIWDKLGAKVEKQECLVLNIVFDYENKTHESLWKWDVEFLEFPKFEVE